MIDKEEWRPVPGFDLLEASSWGRVRSLPYEVRMPRGGFKVVQMKPTFGVVCRSAKGASHVYRNILFRRLNHKAHRMVCLAFNGEPPTGCPEVLHDDENALNNRPGNLRWGTRKENMNAPGFIAYCRSRTGDSSPARKGQRNREDRSAAQARRDRHILGGFDF